jgi:hypothetical protein
MSYYIGFRFGWVRAFGRIVGWYDTTLYHHWPGGRRWGCWKVWMQ